MSTRWTVPRAKAWAINFVIALIAGYFGGFLVFAATLVGLEALGALVAAVTGKNP